MKIEENSLINTLMGFISFSLIASAGYILNDIRDIENDRLHKIKRNRPLANGSVSVSNSFLLAIILITTSFFISYKLGKNPLIIIIIYFTLNYFYSIKGKQIRYIDILILSSFYIIRIFYGASINNIPLTGWFLATLTLSVLALSINKRYMECKNSEKEVIPGRGYNKNHQQFLQIMMINFSISSIVLLNIHAYFVLNITSPFFYVLLNLSAAGITLFYFDETNDSKEDPVKKILNNKKLLLTLLMFLAIYMFEIIRKNK
jgi:4-hydroxybenzoate polyprenyltransferase